MARIVNDQAERWEIRRTTPRCAQLPHKVGMRRLAPRPSPSLSLAALIYLARKVPSQPNPLTH